MSEFPLKTRTVALYARVSTEEQREGQNIDSQVAELERFAASNRWPVARIYKDEGWSGSILARPELDRLRDDASKALFDAVLLNDVDRLARDVAHLGIIKRDLERHGIQVVFRKLPAENSPTHNLMVNILGSFAEFERELIADRTRRGKRHKVEVRKQYVGSHPPYGYRYIPNDKHSNKDGYLEIIPEQASVVRQMFRWVDAEGLSARRVMVRLNEMGVRPKYGDRWAKSSVLRILRSETYCGVWHFGKWQSCEPKATIVTKYRKRTKCSTRLRPKTEWLPVELPEHLKLVDRDQWTRVQARITQNVTFSPRNEKHRYLLKGLVWCGGCTARYVGNPCHGRFYYRCIARCKLRPTITETILDRAVWDAVVQAILEPHLIIAQVEKQEEEKRQQKSLTESEQREIEISLKQLRHEESRLLEAYRLEIISSAQLSQELETLNPRKSALAERQAKASNVKAAPAFAIVRRSVEQYCELARSRIRSASFERRQEFLRNLIRKVIFDGHTVRICGVIPVMSQSDDSRPTEVQDDGRIVTTAFWYCGRNPATDGRIAPQGIEHCGRNLGGESGKRPSEINRPIHNSNPVCEFEVQGEIDLNPRLNPKGKDGKFIGRKKLLSELIA